jgi:hypothetical protein
MAVPMGIWFRGAHYQVGVMAWLLRIMFWCASGAVLVLLRSTQYA